MADILNARIKQKTDTEANWLANPLILLDGEQAFVLGPDNITPINFKIGDGTKTFADLPYWINYAAIVVVATVAPGGTLPAPTAGKLIVLAAGTYTQPAGGTITAPANAFNVYYFNGTSWSLSVSIPVTVDLSGYAKTADVNNLIAITDFTNPVFKHVRGDSEILGTNSFNEVAGSGRSGDGIYEDMTTSGTVTQITLPAYAYADSVIEIRVYKTTDITTAPSTWTLLYSKIFSAGTFNQNSAASAIINLDTPFTVTSGDRIAVLWNANSGTYPTTRYFTAVGSSPARHFFLRSNTTGGAIWAVAWSQSVAGFYAATYKFLAINPNIDIKINAAIAAQAVITTNQIQTALNNFDTIATVYAHVRGDSEIAGTTTFADTNRGDGVYEQMTATGTFNRITIPFYAFTDSAVKLRIFKASTLQLNFSLNTLLYSKDFAVGEFNTSTTAQTVVDLPSSVSYAAGDYLFILCYDNTGASPMIIRRFSADSGTAPFRHSFLRSPVTAGDPFVLTWTQSIPGAGFYGCTFKLELVQRNLQARFDSTLAAAKAYTDAASSATPNILIPSKIYAVVGQPMNVYYDNFIYSNDMGILGFSGWQVVVDCAVGTGYLKWWSITPITAQIGTYTFIVNVYNSSKNIVATKTVSLIIQAAGIATVKHGLFLGDSLTEPGSTAAAVISNMSALGGSQPVWHGTRSGGTTEGRGGWKFSDFAGAGPTFYKFIVSGVVTIGLNDQYTNNGTTFQIAEINVTSGSGYISCIIVAGSNAPTASGVLTRGGTTSGTHDPTISYSSYSVVSGNPLWNAGALDIANYRAAVLGMSSGTKFDLVSIQLGINDIGQQPSAILTDSQISAIITTATTIMAAFIADNASGKIIINLSPSCNNTGGGIIKNSTYPIYFINMMKLWKAILTAYDNGAYNANVIVGFTGAFIHRYYGYQLGTIGVSARYSGINENVHTNFVHPALGGYQDIADGSTGQITAMLKP